MAEKKWVTGMKQNWRWNAPIYDDSLKIGCGNSNMFLFQPHFVEDSHLDEHIFQRGWFNHQLYHLESRWQLAQLPKGGEKYGAMMNQYMGVAPSTFQVV